MNHDLSRLGSTGFQELGAALCLASFGAAMQVMGAGPDGGRDLYHRGPLAWSPTQRQAGEVWDGYTVVQVKHCATPAARPADNAAWLWSQIKKELDDWAGQKVKRGDVPNFLLIVTNVELSPVTDSGGHDKVHRQITQYLQALEDSSRDADDASKGRRLTRLRRMRPLKEWRIWDGNQVNAMLTVHDAVRRDFPAFLSPADVFAHFAEITGSSSIDLEHGLRMHARTTLIGDGIVHFDEAGGDDGSGIPVHEVAIDLPVAIPSSGTRTSIVQHVLLQGAHVLKPKLGLVDGPRHIVLTGVPGNGKTTISKFLVQCYRAAFLEGVVELAEDHRRVIEGTAAALDRMGVSLPRNRRWAMRVDLAEFAEERGHEEDATLLSFIAEKITRRADAGRVTPQALFTWMKRWPWFVVLDGLDEVSQPSIRKRLISRIEEFVSSAEADNCDLLVVVTTRPMGYVERISPSQFERIDLDYLEPAEAVAYGERASRVRLQGDLERIELVVKRLRLAAGDEAMRNMLRTPLQVLIMTIILSSSGVLAPDRYNLFWGYYETVFKRERAKPGGFSRVLQDHAHQIHRLHEEVGFELQARSETSGRTLAVMSSADLERLTHKVLEADGYKPHDIDAELLQRIVTAATHRLVLIAPRGDEGVGFDVRSLQELMASRYITTGPLTSVLQRLTLAAASPHWRNTWIFSAGRLFSNHQEHQQRALLDLLENLDDAAAWRLGKLLPAAPGLALDLTDDGMARSLPSARDRLIHLAMACLADPDPPDPLAIARVLVRYADSSDEHRATVRATFQSGCDGTASRGALAAVQARIPLACDEVGAKQETRWLAETRNSAEGLTSLVEDFWETVEEDLATFPVEVGSRPSFDGAVTALAALRHREWNDDTALQLIDALEDDVTARTVEAALAIVPPGDNPTIATLRSSVVSAIVRRDLGERLRATRTESTEAFE